MCGIVGYVGHRRSSGCSPAGAGPRIPRPPRPRADSHRRQANRVPTSRSLSIFPTSTGSKRATSTSPALLTTSSSRRPSWSHTGSRNPNSSPTRCLPTPTIPKIALWRQCFRRQFDDVNLRATTSRDLAQRKLSRMDVVAILSLQEWGARLMTMSPLDPATAQPLQQELRLDDPRPHGLLPTAGGNDQPTTLDPGPERSRRSAVGPVPDHDVAELHRHS